MLGSAERAKEYLSNEEPNLRIAALSILTQHFGLCSSVQSQFQAMAETDRDSKVRLSARISLAKCYQKQNDPRSKRVLAEIVKDESVADDVRSSCYVLFMGLNQIPPADWAGRFPDDVDWILIDEAIRKQD